MRTHGRLDSRRQLRRCRTLRREAQNGKAPKRLKPKRAQREDAEPQDQQPRQHPAEHTQTPTTTPRVIGKDRCLDTTHQRFSLKQRFMRSPSVVAENCMPLSRAEAHQLGPVSGLAC
jgi:hypothetical protein